MEHLHYTESDTESSGDDVQLAHESSSSYQSDARKSLKRRKPVICDHIEWITDGNGVMTSALCNCCSEMGTFTTWKFDQDKIRKALALMIIVDELPFKFIEGEGFKDFMKEACPMFKIPSRWTVARDCFRLYVDEREKLKSFMKNNCQRVSLTAETWTSLQGIEYMCITAHFIDNEWKLHKKILSFLPVTSRKGEFICKAIETCVLNWGLKNVFTITLNNASSNDTSLESLKKRILNWGCSVANCKFLYGRCIVEVINLVVSNVLKDANPSVERVRDAVKYIRSCPARISNFKECVECEEMSSTNSLCLDVATGWNSTYLMLKTAVQFEKAYERYEKQEPSFVLDLGVDSVPKFLDWSCVKRLSDLLHHFYELTSSISDSVNCSSCFVKISDLWYNLNECKKSDDSDIRKLGESMKINMEKHLGDPEKMNKIIFWANIFDPRDKIEFMEYTFCGMYGAEIGKRLFQSVKDELFELFEEYKTKYHPQNDTSVENSLSSYPDCTGTSSTSDVLGLSLRERFKKFKMEKAKDLPKRSELEKYLSEEIMDNSPNLDVLEWWKLNSVRFPVLSKMARDILAVPVSTVVSGSAFNTNGRVLDPFRSSLTPMIVEALICAQNWLRRSKTETNVEEDIEELDSLEEDFSIADLED